MRLAVLLSCLIVACGGPQPVAKRNQPVVVGAPLEVAAADPTSADPTSADPTSADPTVVSEDPASGLHLESPAISIPNARSYQGYVLGGLPSQQQLDAALEAGFESAMSLMGTDEAGGPELARYGASRGLRYLRFTIAGENDLTESMAWQFAATESMLGKPAIIHCSSGQRVASIFALKAFFVDELAAEEAYAIGEALGMGEYAARVRTLLEL